MIAGRTDQVQGVQRSRSRGAPADLGFGRGETMFHSVAVIGAPSNIGIRPYDDGRARHLDRVPDILRERDLIRRLGAMDLGNVTPPPYVDFVRPPNRARNEEQVVAYARSLSERVAEAVELGRFAVVLGGDCSNVLGSLLGIRRSVKGPIGLAYVDAHADFATPEESRTGSVASMALALAVGRGNSPLARLAGRSPLVEGRHVALIGRRDAAQAWYGHAALAASPILDIPDGDLEDRSLRRHRCSRAGARGGAGRPRFLDPSGCRRAESSRDAGR